MTFGRDMTQIRPKNPLKKALPKAVLPKSSDKHSQDVGNLFPTFFLTGTCERKIFLSPFSLRCEKKNFSHGSQSEKILGVFIRSFGSKLNGSRDQRMYAKVG